MAPGNDLARGGLHIVALDGPPHDNGTISPFKSRMHALLQLVFNGRQATQTRATTVVFKNLRWTRLEVKQQRMGITRGSQQYGMKQFPNER